MEDKKPRTERRQSVEMDLMQEQALSPQEQAILDAKLPRYTVADPTQAETLALLGKLLPHLQPNPVIAPDPPTPRFSELLEGAQTKPYEATVWSRMLGWLGVHVSTPHRVMGASILLLCLIIGWAEPSLASSLPGGERLSWLPFLLPLFTGVTLSFSLRSLGTPMLELERSLPISPAYRLMSRAIAIVSTCALAALAASTLLVLWTAPYGLLSLMLSWLSPLLLYCAGTVWLMLRFGPVSGSLSMALLWVTQPFLLEALGVFYFIGDPVMTGWLTSKLIALGFVCILIGDIVRMLRKLNLSYATRTRRSA